MSSIMRWRNGLMVLSVMAITPVSHEVSEPHDLETGRAILLIPTSNPPRARSRWGVYRESGLVHGLGAAIMCHTRASVTLPEPGQADRMTQSGVTALAYGWAASRHR